MSGSGKSVFEVLDDRTAPAVRRPRYADDVKTDRNLMNPPPMQELKSRPGHSMLLSRIDRLPGSAVVG
jgi:hypothetical protein